MTTQTGSWIEVPSSTVRQWVEEFLRSGNLRVLSTISGYQEGDRIYIVYHFVHQEQGALNLRVSVPLAEPKLPSISPALPGALLYEREIQDLLGVQFEDILDGRRLILPEDFPSGVYPLRSDYHYHGTLEGENAPAAQEGKTA